MILYKYLPSERTDVILNRKIRFTQYGALNDPSEIKLYFDKNAEEKAIGVLGAMEIKELVILIEKEYDKYPYLKALISKDKFKILAKSRGGLVKDIAGIEPFIVNMLPFIYQNTVDSHLGALSLSELNDNKLMWAHYAEGNKGYVIGFDSSNSFFNQKNTDKDDLGCLINIEYFDSPPMINLMNTNGRELFFKKHLEWKYEAEVRMLLRLSDSSETINEAPYPIHLFEFPPEAVSEVIFGEKMSENYKNAIKLGLESDDRLSHVRCYRACQPSSSYAIRIEIIN